jgi:hypothetical protein
MGAALTYARRYTLFTLVGIAGEDDLDAPDLLLSPAAETKADHPLEIKKDRLNGGQGQLAHQGSSGYRSKRDRPATRPKFEPEASAALREQLTSELNAIRSSDEAAIWAHRVIGAKNTLSTADAQRVEELFQARLTSLSSSTESPTHAEPTRHQHRGKGRHRAPVDKTVLALPTLRRIRDRDHVKAVAKHPCLVCGRRPTDAHHLRFAQSPALGSKVSDEFTVPLCRGHHREVHRWANEVAWWKKIGVDARAAARLLWLKTHPLPPSP